MDIMSLLLDASDDEGESLERKHIRDEVMTLLFAGHDTTTSTVAFMFYELARNPRIADDRGDLVEMVVDETLRKYPPAYIGPRRALETFAFEGVRVPGGAHVEYCSWASHHLPHVFPEPEESARSASARRTRPCSRAVPTCRSAGDRARASACASDWRRWP